MNEFIAIICSLFRNRWSKKYRSNYGRDYGWHIEYEGKVVGNLTNPEFEDMFWFSYQLVPKDKASEVILFDKDKWVHGRFKFRCRKLNKYAKNAFSGEVTPAKTGNRVLMRGLYL